MRVIIITEDGVASGRVRTKVPRVSHFNAGTADIMMTIIGEQKVSGVEDILRNRIELGALRRVDVGEDTPQRVIDQLVDNPMFAGFETNDLQLIAPYFMIFAAPAGATIIREGEAGQFLCIVAEGKLSIYKGGEEGRRRKITVLRRGRSLGEMSLIDGLPNSATAETDEDSVLLVLTRNNLLRITQDHPKVGVKWLWQLAKLVSQRLRQTTGVLLDYID